MTQISSLLEDQEEEVYWCFFFSHKYKVEVIFWTETSESSNNILYAFTFYFQKLTRSVEAEA